MIFFREPHQAFPSFPRRAQIIHLIPPLLFSLLCGALAFLLPSFSFEKNLSFNDLNIPVFVQVLNSWSDFFDPAHFFKGRFCFFILSWLYIVSLMDLYRWAGLRVYGLRNSFLIGAFSFPSLIFFDLKTIYAPLLVCWVLGLRSFIKVIYGYQREWIFLGGILAFGLMLHPIFAVLPLAFVFTLLILHLKKSESVKEIFFNDSFFVGVGLFILIFFPSLSSFFASKSPAEHNEYLLQMSSSFRDLFIWDGSWNNLWGTIKRLAVFSAISSLAHGSFAIIFIIASLTVSFRRIFYYFRKKFYLPPHILQFGEITEIKYSAAVFFASVSLILFTFGFVLALFNSKEFPWIWCWLSIPAAAPLYWRRFSGLKFIWFFFGALINLSLVTGVAVYSYLHLNEFIWQIREILLWLLFF